MDDLKEVERKLAMESRILGKRCFQQHVNRHRIADPPSASDFDPDQPVVLSLISGRRGNILWVSYWILRR